MIDWFQCHASYTRVLLLRDLYFWWPYFLRVDATSCLLYRCNTLLRFKVASCRRIFKHETQFSARKYASLHFLVAGDYLTKPVSIPSRTQTSGPSMTEQRPDKEDGFSPSSTEPSLLHPYGGYSVSSRSDFFSLVDWTWTWTTRC